MKKLIFIIIVGVLAWKFGVPYYNEHYSKPEMPDGMTIATEMCKDHKGLDSFNVEMPSYTMKALCNDGIMYDKHLSMRN